MFENYVDSPLAEGWQRWHGDRWREAMDFFVPTRARADLRAYLTPRTYIDRIAAPTFICRSDAENLAHPLSQAFEWQDLARDSQLWIEPGVANPALTMSCADQVATRFERFGADRAGRRDAVPA